jgi:DNA-directed RNA polymerase specialized sigma24 family protein
MRTIATNKVRDAGRKWLDSKRFSILAEVSFVELESWDAPAEEIPLAVYTEWEAATMAEFIAGLPLVYRTVIEMLVCGHSPKIIAVRIGIEQKQVYRIVGCVRDLAKKDR